MDEVSKWLLGVFSNIIQVSQEKLALDPMPTTVLRLKKVLRKNGYERLYWSEQKCYTIPTFILRCYHYDIIHELLFRHDKVADTYTCYATQISASQSGTSEFHKLMGCILKYK